MKTSKIIFLILLGTIAGVILAKMLDIRINGSKNDDIARLIKVKRFPLPAFKVFCMTNSRDVILVRNDSSFIEVKSLENSVTPKVNYELLVDTLTLSGFEKLVHENFSVIIYSTDTLKKVLMKNSNLAIDHFRFSKLSLDLYGSKVFMTHDETKSNRNALLDIVARNHSEVNSDQFYVDFLKIVLQNSRANLSFFAKKIDVTLSDRSIIYLQTPGEISYKKDETSKLNLIDN